MRVTGIYRKRRRYRFAIPPVSNGNNRWYQRGKILKEGQARALEDFGGVPRMLVPDNAATATDRSSVYVMLVNAEYQRFCV